MRPPSLRVAAWAWAASRRLRRGLARGIDVIGATTPSPGAPASQRSTVEAVLRATRASCLVRSAVLQRWDTDHGRPRPLIIGVAKEGDGIAAHAWLDGEPDGGFVEIHRRGALFRT